MNYDSSEANAHMNAKNKDPERNEGKLQSIKKVSYFLWSPADEGKSQKQR